MATDKKSFILYTDVLPMLRKLPRELRGDLMLIIYEYVNDLGDPVIDDLVLQVAFEPIKQALKRDLVKWEATIEKKASSGRIGGKKSGEARRSKSKQGKAKEADASIAKRNEHVSVNVNVNDSVNVNGNDNEKKEVHTPGAIAPGEHALQLHIKSNFPKILKMEKQLKPAEAEKLVALFPKQVIQDVLEAMENHKKLLTNYTSVYLTINNWSKTRVKNDTTNVYQQKSGYKPNQNNRGSDELIPADKDFGHFPGRSAITGGNGGGTDQGQEG